MKFTHLFFFALLFSFNSYCQIVTPSFINYTTCPDDFSQVNNCVGWRQPTGGTSDYFNDCATGTIVDVPNNVFGYQDAFNKAYTGLYTLASYAMYDYKEYIGTTIAPLTVGNTYTVSITVSLSDSSNIATDGLGILFTTTPVDQPILYSTLPMTPQVDFSSYGPITDKINWVTLTGSFVAADAYTNMTVGCFKPITTLALDTISDNLTMGGISYYYIGRIGNPDSTLPGDTTVAPIDTTKTPIPDTADYVFPNAFTPNNDGLNDVFRIEGKGNNQYKGYTMRVYNRWGQCVFTTLDPNQGWDGSQNGIPCDVGVYIYFAAFGLNDEQHLAKGNVTLVR